MVLAAAVRPENGKVPTGSRYSIIPPAPRWAMAALVAVATVSAAPMAQAQDATAPSSITVQGAGEVSVQADVARVTIGVVERADTAAAAAAALDQALSSALGALEAAGVVREALRTTSLRLDVVQSYDQETQIQRVTGYEASSSVELTVRDLDRLGPLLDAAVTAGANQIAGVSFETSGKAALKAEARRAAVADARARAELYAQAAGVTLGPLIELRETGDGGFEPMARMSLADAGPPILAGDLTVRADITASWAIGTP